MAPGRPVEKIIDENFTRLEKKDDKSNRWFWKCNHCTDAPPIEGRDGNLQGHLIDPLAVKCPNAPQDVRQQARNSAMGAEWSIGTLLAVKGVSSG